MVSHSFSHSFCYWPAPNPGSCKRWIFCKVQYICLAVVLAACSSFYQTKDITSFPEAVRTGRRRTRMQGWVISTFHSLSISVLYLCHKCVLCPACIVKGTIRSSLFFLLLLTSQRLFYKHFLANRNAKGNCSIILSSLLFLWPTQMDYWDLTLKTVAFQLFRWRIGSAGEKNAGNYF